MVYSPERRKRVRDALRPLTENVVREERGQSGRPIFALILLGVLLTTEGEKLQELVDRYLKFQYEVFRKHPEQEIIKAEDVAASLRLAAEDVVVLGQLINIRDNSWNAAAWREPNWTVQALSETEIWEDLAEAFEEWVMPYYKPETAVFEEDRRKELNSLGLSPSPSLIDYLSGPCLDKQPAAKNTDGGRFERRYQVFVSSMYCDLVEEREHVLRALLEMNCIPSGMELFPAADDAKWDLIRRLIDNCDYFVVIVAGKYGSVTTNGRSFTEMEYDHALSTHKPVMGFFHSDISKLPGERLEDSDEGRLKLSRFYGED